MSQRLTVPDGFPDVLRDFTREVLRNYPRDAEVEDPERWIYEFAAQHFVGASGAAADSREHRDEEPHGDAAPDSMQEKLAKILERFDDERSGFLSRQEFRQAMSVFVEEVHLSEQQLRLLVSEADENEDGNIDYTEFVPLGLEALEATPEGFSKDEGQNAALLHGHTPNELLSLLQGVCERLDADQSGLLPRESFTDAVRHPDLGLTRREVNLILHEAPETDDGKVAYGDFVEEAVRLAEEIYRLQFSLSLAPRSADDLQELFFSAMEDADRDGKGALPMDVIADCVRQADVGLTTVQAYALLFLADDAAEGGIVPCESFSRAAAMLVSQLFTLSESQDRSDALLATREHDPRLKEVAGMHQEEFNQWIERTLAQLDEAESGVCAQGGAAEALQGGGLGRDDALAVLSVATVPGEPKVEIGPVVDYAWPIIMQVREYKLIRDEEL